MFCIAALGEDIGLICQTFVMFLHPGDDAYSESISIVSSEVAGDRIDRGGEETEEEPLVNGFSDLHLRDQDAPSPARPEDPAAAPPPDSQEPRTAEHRETAHDVIDMFSQKTGLLFVQRSIVVESCMADLRWKWGKILFSYMLARLELAKAKASSDVATELLTFTLFFLWDR